MFDSPPFDTFNVVYLMYCDGGSFAGDSEQQAADGTMVQYRGKRIFDAAFDELIKMGLGNASQLLYSGCSAGGLTAYIHADYVADKMAAVNSDMITLVLADAMYDLPESNVDGYPQFPLRMQFLVDYMNVTDSGNVDDDCLNDKSEDDQWQCFYGAIMAQYVQTPMFILNSKYDTWQQNAILNIPCDGDITTCGDDDKKAFVDYGRKMLDSLQNNLPDRHSAFVSNCPQHCQTGENVWVTESIDSVAMGDAVTTWWNAAIENGGKVEKGVVHVDLSDEILDEGNTC